jgi:PIN domain nuclease of toxin-antitoxin system
MLWSLTSSKAMPTKAAKLIQNPANQIICSAVSIWEVAIKHNNGGRKTGNVPMSGQALLDEIEQLDVVLLPITPQHAARVGELPNYHRDPFDRLLVAQAMHEGLTLLTHDEALSAYGDCVMVV